MPKRKNDLQTELKDLDVDRVDGVDRPATGRAFALFKSEQSTDMLEIMAALKRISKSTEEIYADLIATACDRFIMKMLDSRDKPIGYVVRGEDMSSPLFKTLDEAVALVSRAIRGEIADDNKHGRPSGMGGGAMDSTHPGERMNTGMTTNFLDPGATVRDRSSDLLDGEYDHTGNRRKSLTELHNDSMRKRGRANRAGRKAFIQ